MIQFGFLSCHFNLFVVLIIGLQLPVVIVTAQRTQRSNVRQCLCLMHFHLGSNCFNVSVGERPFARLLDAPARAPSLCATASFPAALTQTTLVKTRHHKTNSPFPFNCTFHFEQNQTWSPPPLGRTSFHRTSLSLIDRASSTMAHTHGTQMASPMSMEVRTMSIFPSSH